jgi:hypothetical protein
LFPGTGRFRETLDKKSIFIVVLGLVVSNFSKGTRLPAGVFFAGSKRRFTGYSDAFADKAYGNPENFGNSCMATNPIIHLWQR